MNAKKRKRAVKPNAKVALVENTTPLIKPSTTPDKKKVRSISASVRRLVVCHSQLTCSEVAQRLVEEGWDVEEVQRRKSTIATLRCDALATIAIAREEGWSKRGGRN